MLFFYLSLIETQEEKDKFEQLYIKYRKLMFYVSKEILHDDFLAEDAVHNAFLRIIKHLEKINEISCHKTKSFMVIVVENVSKDLYNQRTNDRKIYFDDVDYDIIDDCDMEENIIQQINIEDIVKKIEMLPNTYRDVLMLKCIHELTDKEIATLLDISPAAARKRIERARQNINELCKEENR